MANASVVIKIFTTDASILSYDRILVVLLHWLKVSLWEETCWTSLWSCLSLYDVTAVAALPPDLTVSLEEVTVSKSAEEFEVTALVLSLDFSDVLECCCDCRESLSCCNFCELLVKNIPLLQEGSPELFQPHQQDKLQ